MEALCLSPKSLIDGLPLTGYIYNNICVAPGQFLEQKDMMG